MSVDWDKDCHFQGHFQGHVTVTHKVIRQCYNIGLYLFDFPNPENEITITLTNVLYAKKFHDMTT